MAKVKLFLLWIHLLSRLIVANWPTGVKTPAQLDVLVVHWLLEVSREQAEPWREFGVSK